MSWQPRVEEFRLSSSVSLQAKNWSLGTSGLLWVGVHGWPPSNMLSGSLITAAAWGSSRGTSMMEILLCEIGSSTVGARQSGPSSKRLKDDT